MILKIFYQNINLANIYLDNNNVTIKCEKSIIGDKKKIKGKIYTVVNKSILKKMIQNNEDVTCVCISKIFVHMRHESAMVQNMGRSRARSKSKSSVSGSNKIDLVMLN